MDCLFVGIREVSFKAPDGRDITGVNIYVTHPSDYVKGVMCEKFFISSSQERLCDYVRNLALNCKVVLFFNQFGKISDIQKTS